MSVPLTVAVFLFVNMLPALALVFYLTRKYERIGLIDRLILAVILSPLVLVLVSFLEEVAGVPQNGIILSLNIAVLAVLNLFLLGRFFRRKEYYALRFSWAKGLACALFAALVLFRVLPAAEMLAPILHDPIAHSEWLKYLNTNHFTTDQQWYPQGLEYYLNYYASFLDLSYPRIILISHNYLLSLFPVSMYYLGLLSFRGRDRWLLYPMIMFVVAAVLARPFEFFFIGGKNSMVFVFTVTPFLLYLITTTRSRWDYVVATVLVFSATIIHYPTGFVLLFILFFINIGSVISIEAGKPALDRQALSGYLIALGTITVLGALMLLQILPRYLNLPVAADRTLDFPVYYIKVKGVLSYVLNDSIRDRRATLGTYPLAAFALATVALLFVPDKNKKLPGKLLISFAALYGIGLLLLLMKDKTYGIFYNSEMRHFFVIVLAVTVAWFAWYILKITLFRATGSALAAALVLVLLGSVFMYRGLEQYRKYQTVRAGLETVSGSDLQAFDYIDEKLEHDRKMLIQMGSPADISGVVAGADSGVWIPSFTGMEVEVSFLDFSSLRSEEIYELYMDVAENSSDPGPVRELYCRFDIGYVFFGSRPVYFNNMQREMLDTSSLFEKIYDDGATIYRLTPEGGEAACG